MNLDLMLNDENPLDFDFADNGPLSYDLPPILFSGAQDNSVDQLSELQNASLTTAEMDLLGTFSDKFHGIDLGVDNVAHALPTETINWGEEQSTHPTLSQALIPVHEPDFICYGMLFEYEVKLVSSNMNDAMRTLRASAANQQTPFKEHVQRFTLERRPECVVICLEKGVTFGYLKEGQGRVLTAVMGRWPSLKFEGVAYTHSMVEQISNVTKSHERKVRIDINIYGPEQIASAVGDELSSNKAYLQRPDHHQQNVAYRNPHFIEFEGVTTSSRKHHYVWKDSSSEALPVEERDRLQTMMAEVRETLNQVDEPIRTQGDRRLLTRLLPHQERALTFMSRRESGVIPDEDRLWQKKTIEGQEKYVHTVSKTLSTEQPDEKGGGVLADEMGMGKSLTMIALIVQTLSEAHQSASRMQVSEEYTGTADTFVHSTLVVVPSELLINTWTKQIRQHVGDSLTFVKYHGSQRPKNVNSLSKADIVITTYHTLAVEYKEKRSLLHKIHWFRIVLDEGHIIRRPATIFHKTCYKLEARSRWALTGTPIQNKLDDIGALFVFIRAEPFHSMAQFRSSITLPFERGDRSVKEKLVLLYKSLCISRPRSKAQLPEPVERVRELDFTAAERHLYNRTANIMNRATRQIVGHVEDQKRFGLFQTILQLRISCNHGTWQKLLSWRRNHLQDMREAIEAERSAEDLRCGGCEQPPASLESYKRYTGCGHFLCSDCRKDLAGHNEASHFHGPCPLCRVQTRPFQHRRDREYVSETIPLFEEFEQGNEDNQAGGTDNAQSIHEEDVDYFEKSGHSTKMLALMEDVKENLWTTKSIIFSCWTSTLNLVSKHLRQESIPFLRIDGETPAKKRQHLLDQFDDESVRVLIMTTGTGAFGLNITSAQRVFIVESQWNPSVENQAISRAIRIGQTENVLVTRYIIQGTIEEEMRSQQKRKLDAAQMVTRRRDLTQPRQ